MPTCWVCGLKAVLHGGLASSFHAIRVGVVSCVSGMSFDVEDEQDASQQIAIALLCVLSGVSIYVRLILASFSPGDQRLQCQYVGFVVSKLWCMAALPRVVNSESGCAVAASDIIANSAVAVIQSLQRRGQVATWVYDRRPGVRPV